MTNKFQNKYRIPSTRLQNWDYCWAGAYFITICTKNREHYFGEIENGEMRLSEIGHIAEQEWIKTFDMRPDMNIQMGEFVVMPNHFHAIIIIGENEYNQRDDDGDDHRCCRDAMHCVSTSSQPHNNPKPHYIPMATTETPMTTTTTPPQTQCVPTKQPHEINAPKNRFGPQSKNLASIIRGFKIGVTTHARKINSEFAWQRLYHDHIIRDEQSFKRIQTYIYENPAKWVDDIFYNF